MYKLVDDRNKIGAAINLTVVKTLQQAMNEDEMVVALEADLGGASGFSKIKSSHPQQFVECGIAEANMMGVAAGMSMLGYKPFVHTFSPFVVRRAFDQVYLSGGYAKNTINIYGSDPGYTSAHNGGTHTTFEDIAIMRTLPDAVIVDACDDVQIAWVVKEFLKLKGIHYLRANRKAVRKVYTDDSRFKLGKGNVLKTGNDILIIAAGELVSDALDAAEMLQEKGISVEVIDMFTIKPLDEELIKNEVKGKKAVITFENASVYGGLGSAVNDVLVNCPQRVKVKNIGIRDLYGQVGSVDYLKKTFHLTAADVVEETIKLLNRE